MLLELAPAWSMELDRGPDWLFIKLQPPRSGDMAEIRLAEMVWQQLEQCFCHRVVIELDEVGYLRSWMIGELVRLHKRVTTQGGMLRLSGVSPEAETVLRICRLGDRFPAYRSRTEAVMGHRPPAKTYPGE